MISGDKWAMVTGNLCAGCTITWNFLVLEKRQEKMSLIVTYILICFSAFVHVLGKWKADNLRTRYGFKNIFLANNIELINH